MATTSTSISNQQDVPLGSPNSPILRRQSVRKRVTPTLAGIPVPNTLPHRRINARLIYNDYKPKGPVSMGVRIRNFFALVSMLAFPLCIFVVPVWWHAPEYPRVVIALTTTQERLDQLQPIVDSLLSQQPDLLLLIVPSTSPSRKNNGDPTPQTLPLYLQERRQGVSSTEPSRLKVIYARQTYGPPSITSSILTVLSDELQGVEMQPSNDGTILSNQVAESETRILVFDDQFSLPSVQSLVKASLHYPEAVLSTVGGNWRSRFRQIKWILEPNSPLNQFPNLVLHTVRVSYPVDLLDSSRGIVFRMGLLLPHLDSITDKLDRLVDQVSSPRKLDPVVLEHGAEDVLWCGLLETLKIPRRIVPLPVHPQVVETNVNIHRNATAMVKSDPIIFSRRHWMTSAYELQKEWNIWTEHTFWDWSKLTAKQHEAMECEGKFEPDCQLSKEYSYCRPNSQHCGDDATDFGHLWNTGLGRL